VELRDVYKLIHDFRLGLSTHEKHTQKIVDDVFGRLYKVEQKILSIEEMNDAIETRMRDKFK
jgi:hypothetical protein